MLRDSLWMRRLFGSAATKEMSDWLAVVQFYHPSHAADIPWISDFCYQFRTPVLLAKTRVVASQVPDKIQTPVPDFVKSLSVYETESRHVLSFIRLLLSADPRLSISIQQRRVPILRPSVCPRTEGIALPKLKPANLESQRPTTTGTLGATTRKTLRPIKRLFKLDQHKIQMHGAIITISASYAQAH
jgi:hypothetical protein